MKWILESPKEPYFIEYRGDWMLLEIRPDSRMTDYTAILKEYYGEIVTKFPPVCQEDTKMFYYMIPNNWLKMHGYPKHRRTKWIISWDITSSQ